MPFLFKARTFASTDPMDGKHPTYIDNPSPTAVEISHSRDAAWHAFSSIPGETPQPRLPLTGARFLS